MDYQAIINQYYPEENKLKHILLVHSRSVANKALAIVDQHPELHIDRQFVEEAAMLHDIGIFKCNAPGIQCFCNAPYIPPLPQQDFLPETTEEKLICYADKFFSKTHLDIEKTFEQAVKSLAKFGCEGVERFIVWHNMFEPTTR